MLVSVTLSAASASSRCSALVAPTMGAVTPVLCSSQARAICADGRSHGRVDFGRENVIVSAGEELAEQPAGDLFAHAMRVDVGGVEEDDAVFGCPSDDRLGLAFIEHPLAPLPIAVAHHAQAYA